MVMSRRKGRVLLVGVVAIGALGWSVWLVAQPTLLERGGTPLVWEECEPAQAEIMILGTVHFAQQSVIDVLAPERQAELEALVAALETFGPTKVAVEQAWARQDEVAEAYRAYLESGGKTDSRNETSQIGYRLARRSGHSTVHAVDVPMPLWDDSIQVFDDRFPTARQRLRWKWDVRYPSRGAASGPGDDSGAAGGDASIVDILIRHNLDQPPADSELYARFLPLVEEDVYAGALKLRPWYDRNLRIVQNFFRILDDGDERLLFVVGSSHLRILKQILDLTPQLCAVDAVPYLRESSRRIQEP